MNIVHTLAVLIVLPIFLFIGLLPFEIINAIHERQERRKGH